MVSYRQQSLTLCLLAETFMKDISPKYADAPSLQMVQSQHHKVACLYAAAITLSNYDERDLAQEQFDRFERIFSSVGRDTQTADADVVQQRQLLLDILKSR